MHAICAGLFVRCHPSSAGIEYQEEDPSEIVDGGAESYGDEEAYAGEGPDEEENGEQVGVEGEEVEDEDDVGIAEAEPTGFQRYVQLPRFDSKACQAIAGSKSPSVNKCFSAHRPSTKLVRGWLPRLSAEPLSKDSTSRAKRRSM
jgi:hypothetical protein